MNVLKKDVKQRKTCPFVLRKVDLPASSFLLSDDSEGAFLASVLRTPVVG